MSMPQTSFPNMGRIPFSPPVTDSAYGRELAQKVDERLRRGGFDIGKFPGEQRRGITRQFIEADEKLEDTRSSRSGVATR